MADPVQINGPGGDLAHDLSFNIPGLMSSAVPTPPPNPYQGQWNDLITTLRSRASGVPAMSQFGYQQALTDHMQALQRMNPYQRAQMAGQVMPQLNTNYANSAARESAANNQALGNAIAGGQAGLFGPVGLQMQAWQAQNQLNAQQWGALSGALAGVGGMVGHG